MTKTAAEAEPREDEIVYPTQDETAKRLATIELFRLGVSNQPMRMTPDSYVGIVGQARRYNRDEHSDLSLIQTELDRVFAPGWIAAADIVLTDAVVADFTIAYNADNPMAVDLTYGNAGVPNDAVYFHPGDGSTLEGAGPFTHAYAAEGAYTVTCEVRVAERSWETSQQTVVPDGWSPVMADADDEVDEEAPTKSRRRGK